jgi:hypothetical protein
MKCINLSGLIIIIIILTGLMQPLQAQQLASERPVESFYSPTAKQKLQAKNNVRQPAAQKARQALPSEQALQQPSVPARIQPEKKQATRTAGSGIKVRPQLASERPVDMDKINRQRRQNLD